MTGPRQSRMSVPEREEYGSLEPEPMPAQRLAWTTARQWLDEARYYWIATTRPDGRPHTVPVWAVWLDERLWFAMSPDTATSRNLAHSAYAVVHPDGAADVVIVEGPVRRQAAGDVQPAVVDAYEVKYGWKLDPADPGMPFHALTPQLAFGWLATDVRQTASRWAFD